ncbi:hypothetical protein [Corallococcus llansteffanensis]|uniref:hypothetical protein n=1 Tax=Corallococcus llansteffanensis TaxID=2316731 RepID=UPI0011C4953A|nr:hypothetical protein [Corallococcus llansteffanensis]
MARPSWSVALLAIGLLSIFQSAEGREVTVTGRVVTYGTSTPVREALVRLLDECEAPNRQELHRVITKDDGSFSVTVDTDRDTLCIHTRTNHHHGKRDPRKLGTTNPTTLDLGDIILKPLKLGFINTEGFTEHFYALESNKSAQQQLLDELSFAKNKDEVDVLLKSNPKIKQRLLDDCDPSKEACRKNKSRIERDIDR